jgi:hypothetical protein
MQHHTNDGWAGYAVNSVQAGNATLCIEGCSRNESLCTTACCKCSLHPCTCPWVCSCVVLMCTNALFVCLKVNACLERICLETGFARNEVFGHEPTSQLCMTWCPPKTICVRASSRNACMCYGLPTEGPQGLQHTETCTGLLWRGTFLPLRQVSVVHSIV